VEDGLQIGWWIIGCWAGIRLSGYFGWFVGRSLTEWVEGSRVILDELIIPDFLIWNLYKHGIQTHIGL
jgi:hypothetical protein